MTGIVLPRPEYVIQEVDTCRQLRNDATLMEGVKRGMKARLEGRVKPWAQVKQELGI